MNSALRVGALALCFLFPTLSAVAWVGSAKDRLMERATAEHEAPKVSVASLSDEGYCTPELKKILRRALRSCGLLGGGDGRGCQPLEAKHVATLPGEDFNALFQPMKDRGGIIQFGQGAAELDVADKALVNKVFSDQQGASYFFVVSRASPEGQVERNRELSKSRAEAVLAHLRGTFNDPDLDREVGLLWLGEEFAQLENNFCDWRRSAADEPTQAAAGTADAADPNAALNQCSPEDLNRSAFVAWIDCSL